jgi:hypothetical protein
MKLFAIAFGATCGVAAVLFGITFASLRFFGLDDPAGAAAALAALPILTCPDSPDHR